MGCVRAPQLGNVFDFAASTRRSRACGWRGVPVGHPTTGVIDSGVSLGKGFVRGQLLVIVAVKETASFDTGAASASRR